MHQPAKHLDVPMIEPLENRRMLSGDVVPAFAGRLPSVLAPTGATHASLRLTDSGTTPTTGAVTIELFASTGNSLNSSDVLLATIQKSVRLKPKGSTIATLSFPAPTTLPDGDYFLLVQVVGSSTIAISPKPIAFQNPFSDLAVQFSQLPSRPIEMDGPSTGQQTATATISNSGNVTENGTVNLNFYLSADSVLDNSDPLLATFANKPISLKPGGHQAVSFKIAVPPGTAVGSYFLFAVMTPGSSLHDSNADNNVAMSSQRVAVVSTLPRPARIINQTNSVDVIVNVDETDTVICTDTGNCDGSSNSDGSSDGTNGSSDDSSDQSDSGQSDTAPSGSQDAPGSDSSGDDSSSDDSDSGSMDDGG